MATDETAAPPPPPPLPPLGPAQLLEEPLPEVKAEAPGSDAAAVLSNDGNGTIAAIDVAGGVNGGADPTLISSVDCEMQAAAAQAAAEAGFGSDRKRNGDTRRSCACKKSQCLKLYCPCFSSGEYCPDTCGCQPCYNKAIYAEAVQSAHRDALIRSRRQPAAKIIQTVDANGTDAGNKTPGSNPLKRGCSCKKSNCEKKYCDCFESKGGCSIYCKCVVCLNPFGRKEGNDGEDYKHYLYTGAGADVEQTDDEDDAGEERSPHQHSPLSRESSFQQNPGNGRNSSSRDRHLYAQPLAQRQPHPHPWFTGKRQHHLNGRVDDAAAVGGLVEYKAPSAEWQLAGGGKPEESAYSIPRCIEIMNNMAELSQQEKALAPDVFLQANNREIFVSLSPEVRTMWLRRKIQQLTT